MGRKTVYNAIFTPELYEQVSKENKEILKEFVEYLKSTDKSQQTIYQYENDIKIFFIWNLKNNNNKFFVDFTKRDVMKFQNHLLHELKHSSNRIRRIRSVLSSMANFVENIMDDLYPNFRNIINKIPAPSKQLVREKTVLEDEQVQYLLDYLVENKMYQHACAFALGVASGSRKAELLRLKPSYFVEENIKYGALYKTPELIKTKGRGKGKMIYRYILVSKFKPYFDLWMEEKKKLGIEEDVMFWSNHLGQWQPADITTLDSWALTFKRILGVDFYWHSLRHFFTTALSESNIPAEVIKNLVGWESVDMVSLYTDSDIDEELGKYFDENGVKDVEKKGLSDLK